MRKVLRVLSVITSLVFVFGCAVVCAAGRFAGANQLLTIEANTAIVGDAPAGAAPAEAAGAGVLPAGVAPEGIARHTGQLIFRFARPLYYEQKEVVAGEAGHPRQEALSVERADPLVDPDEDLLGQVPGLVGVLDVVISHRVNP